MKKFCTVFFTLLLGFTIGSLPSVNAQDEFTLEEVVVTAEKREVDVQDTAMAITAVTGADIRDQAMNTLAETMKYISGLEVAGSIMGGQIYIRGVGAYGGEPATAIMINDIYSGDQMAVMTSMFDIDRIEVLRGPQGTLYGRNATGGTVNVVSRIPIDEFEIMGNFQVGDYALKRFDGAINIPLSEKWAARVALLRETRDGYLSDGAQDSNMFSARGRLLYQPNDNFSLLGTIDYVWEKDHGRNTVPVPGSAGNLPAFFPWVDPDIPIEGWVLPPGADDWTNDPWHPGYLQSVYNTRKAYSLKIDWDLGLGVLTVIPSYSDEYRHNVNDMLAGISTSATGEITNIQEGGTLRSALEARLSSPAESAFIWIIGYYGEKPESAITREPRDPTTWPDANWHFVNYAEPRVTHAFFGQGTYPITDRFRVTGGVRHSADDHSRDYRYGNSQVPSTHPLYPETGGTGIYDSGRIHFEQSIKSTTYKAGIEFDVNEDSMLYAQIVTGFKAGGLNSTAPPTEFKPEDLTAYEFGSKNRFLDSRMQLNLEAYYYNYDNMQAQFPEVISIGGTGESTNAQTIHNAETGINQGIDLEFDYLFTENDRLRAAVTYMDAKYGKLIIPPNPFAGTLVPFVLTDRQRASSPEWVANFGYEHTWRLENGATVEGAFDTKISDGYYTTGEQFLPGAWQEGYHRSDFRVNYRSADGKWTSGVWGKNLENDAQTIFIVPLARRFVNEPRTFGVNVSFRY